MIKQRKKDYLCPSTKTAVVDLEGLICESVRLNMRVMDLDNMNDPTNPLKGVGDAEGEVFYFES